MAPRYYDERATGETNEYGRSIIKPIVRDYLESTPVTTPTTWGYCQYCGREEPLTDAGKLDRHEIGGTANRCCGTGTEPTNPPGPDEPRFAFCHDWSDAHTIGDPKSPGIYPGAAACLKRRGWLYGIGKPGLPGDINDF